MNTCLAHRWTMYGISLAAPALAACPGETVEQTGTGDSETQATSTGDSTVGHSSLPTSTSDTTAEPPTSDTTVEPPTSSTTVEPPDTSETSDTTVDPSTSTGPLTATSSTGDPDTDTGGPSCATFLCGDPAACCAADDECVGGGCVPACASGVRCGDDQGVCCADGEVCVGDACTAPGQGCVDSGDCGPGEFCDPVPGNCLPEPAPLLCEAVPNFETVEAELEWSHTADQVVAMPAVADLDGDGTPELVVNTMRQTGLPTDYAIGEIICLDGATGALKWKIPHEPNNMKHGAHGRSTLAVGDVSGDGKPDVVYAGRQLSDVPAMRVSPVHAVDGDGTLLWTSHTLQNEIARVRIENGAAALANLDNDPMAEVAFGAAIFDHDGLMVVNQAGNGAMFGTPHNKNMPTGYLYPGGIATFANLDGDAALELVTGREAWEIIWTPANPPNVTLAQKWKDISGFAGDGYPAVADLDANGTPEVVLTAWPEIKILDGATGKLWCGVDPTGVACQNNDAARTQPIPVPGQNLGGPATIADYDGDGRPEIGIVTGADFRVFDLHRMGEVIVKPPMDPMPAPGAIYTRWAQVVQDKSSASTGSTVFDFQGDGKVEVATQDECNVSLYDGATGELRLRFMNSSATIHEYPVVADVDGDGDTELIVVANESDTSPNDLCKQKDAGFVTRRGVYVYGAPDASWVPTRELWTQHTYHVTNAESDGNVPMMEQDNWDVPGLNNFRQNVQGAGFFPAPDLTASLAVGLDQCASELVLRATIHNEGAIGVPAGVEVTFYEGVDNWGLVLGTVPTAELLVPGGSVVVTQVVPAPPPGETRSYYVEVDGGLNGGSVLECDESNNDAVVTDAGC